MALVAETTVLASSGGQAAGLTVLVNGGDDPVDAGVVTDGLVHGVDGDDLVPHEGGVLVHPVAVEDTGVTDLTAKTLLTIGAVVLVQLDAEDTGGLGLTGGDTAVSGTLAATTTDGRGRWSIRAWPCSRQRGPSRDEWGGACARWCVGGGTPRSGHAG